MRPTATLAEEIRAVESIPASLGSPEHIERIASLLPFVPQPVTSFGFECRLAEGSQAIDFGVSLAAASGGPAALAAASHGDPRWRDIAAFGARWLDPRSKSRRSVPFVFLEYDADSAAKAVAIPSVFAALDSSIRQTDRRRELAAAREVATALHGGVLPLPVSSQLEICFETLPRGGRVLHVAMMTGRPAASVRLSVLLPPESASAYFAALGARGAAENVAALLSCALGARGDAQIDFDLGPPFGSRVGLGIAPTRRADWPSLLDEAVRLGLCHRAKANSLLDWPALEIVECDGGGWTLLRRELSHLKVASDATGSIEAKAYLGASRLLSAKEGEAAAEVRARAGERARGVAAIPAGSSTTAAGEVPPTRGMRE